MPETFGPASLPLAERLGGTGRRLETGLPSASGPLICCDHITVRHKDPTPGGHLRVVITNHAQRTSSAQRARLLEPDCGGIWRSEHTGAAWFNHTTWMIDSCWLVTPASAALRTAVRRRSVERGTTQQTAASPLGPSPAIRQFAHASPRPASGVPGAPGFKASGPDGVWGFLQE